MARSLGYGGIANTNGARTFSGKEESAVAGPAGVRRRYAQRISFYAILFALIAS